MLPIISGLISGGLSLLSGFGGQSAARKQAKQQVANDILAMEYNERALANKNAANAALAKQLAATKETLTQKHTESSKTHTIQKSYVDVDRMMAAADKAGFNPVTWLNAGGMAAYGISDTTTWDKRSSTDKQTRTGHNAVAAAQLASPEVPQIQASQAPLIPSTAQIIGQAGQAGFQAYDNAAKRQESQEFQKELLNMQLGAIQQANANNARTGRQLVNQGTPSYSTNGGFVTNGGAAGRAGGLSSFLPGSSSSRGGGKGDTGATGVNDPNAAFEPDTPKVMNPFSQFNWKTDIKLPTAEAVEDTYGDVGAEVYGAGKFINDMILTTTGKSGATYIKDGVEYLRTDALSTSVGGKSPARRTWETINKPSPFPPAPKPAWAVPVHSMGRFYD